MKDDFYVLQPLMEDTFDDWLPLMEDNLWWRMTMDEEQPSIEDAFRALPLWGHFCFTKGVLGNFQAIIWLIDLSIGKMRPLFNSPPPKSHQHPVSPFPKCIPHRGIVILCKFAMNLFIFSTGFIWTVTAQNFFYILTFNSITEYFITSCGRSWAKLKFS